jgi:hypothetical protein
METNLLRLRSVVMFGLMTVSAAVIGAEMTDDDRGEAAKEVSIDQVAPPAQATILQAARGGTVQEIERLSRNGTVLYAAAFLADGKQQVMLVAADGTVVAQQTADDDDDDDD